MLGKFASALALIQGAQALTDGVPVEYFYISPLWTFSTNKVVTIFPTSDGQASAQDWPQKANGNAETSIIWQMENRSVLDQNSGEQYLQITHELTMPILQDDIIEFDIKFQAEQTTVDMASTLVTLKYDMFKCRVEQDVLTQGYWKITAEDYNVRSTDGGSTFTTTLDDNVTEQLQGQDWIVWTKDVNMITHLCDAYDNDELNAKYACEKIRCTARRKHTVSDGNDFSFAFDNDRSPTTAADKLIIAAGNAALYINMDSQQDAYKKYITNLYDIELEITESAYTGLAFSAAAIAFVASSMF